MNEEGRRKKEMRRSGDIRLFSTFLHVKRMSVAGLEMSNKAIRSMFT
jgi:hypothetical protein